MDAIKMALDDLLEKYDAEPATPPFERIYPEDDEFSHMFAVLHRKLNQHFLEINGRIATTRHYWADNSRSMLALIDELNEGLHLLRRAGYEIQFDDRYQEAIEACEPWLAPSGGSSVPVDLEKLEVIKYDPVFRRATGTVKLKRDGSSPKLEMVGEGSYAQVYSYVDPDYGIRFALKRARPEIDERDLARFKNEFAVMKELSFPYVVEVYMYDDERN